jgi:hypothetical protein
MKSAPWLLIGCLVLSLVIQNTCPFGAAGKSSVVPRSGHCPLMRQCAAPAEGQVAWASGEAPNHFPFTFLFTTEGLGHTFQIDGFTGSAPLLTLHYPEAYPAELLKPPTA